MHMSPVATPPLPPAAVDVNVAANGLDTAAAAAAAAGLAAAATGAATTLTRTTTIRLYQPTVHSTRGEALGALVGASLTVVGDTVYTFAGFDQYTDELYHSLHRLALGGDFSWQRVVYLKGRPPGKRNDHSTTYWPAQNKLVIFGGSSEDDGVSFNNVALLDLATMTWEHPATQGKAPEPRSRHAATIHDNHLYISGGLAQDGTLLSTLHILNLTNWTWMDPIAFVARSQHVLVVHDGRLFLFGGMYEDLTRSNQLSYMDLMDGAMTHVHIQSTHAPPLHAQRFVQICGNRLVLLVTPSITDKGASGLWTLNLDRMQWRCHAQHLLGGHENFTWHGFAMQEHDHLLYLFGTCDDDDELADQYYGKVLPLDLHEFGIFCPQPPTLSRDLLTRVASFSASSSSSSSSPSSNSLDHHLILIPNDKDDAHVVLPQWLVLVRCPQWSYEGLHVPMSFPAATIHAFAHYLYHDNLPLSLSVYALAPLLVLAHEQALERLQVLCLEALWPALHIDTVSLIYQAACLACVPSLQHHTLQFIFDHFGPVSHSATFRQLPPSCLLSLLSAMPRDAALIYEPNC
ncbi:hypothetical protein BC940DRAFT_310476 [Gongronella butleri]|nr:hypothetical protein BC940DRAFT_310476 [Gongronella butleri]